MKRILTLLLTAALLLSFAACSAKQDSAEEAPSASDSEQTADTGEFPDTSDWRLYDSMLSRLRTERDTAARLELIHSLENRLMSSRCVIPVYSAYDRYLVKEGVDNAYIDVFGAGHYMYASKKGSDSISVAELTEPKSLESLTASDSDCGSVAAQLCGSLFTFSADGAAVPSLAVDAEVLSDGLTCLVTLRDGIKWSDGSDVTADQIAEALDGLVKTDKRFSIIATDDDGKAQVSVTGNRCLRISLSERCGYLRSLFTAPLLCPEKRESDDGVEYISCGAFVCSDWERGIQMTMTRNPNWYDASNVDDLTLRYMFFDSESEARNAFDSGKVDIIPMLSENAADKSANELCAASSGRIYCIAFNSESVVFRGRTAEQSAYIREAVSLLIDRGYICDNILKGKAEPTLSVVPDGMSDGNGAVYTTDFKDRFYTENKEERAVRAEELLSASVSTDSASGADADEEPFCLIYLTDDDPRSVAAAESIQQDLDAAGVQMTICEKSGEEYEKALAEGAYDMTGVNISADVSDPEPYLAFWSADSEQNLCRFGKKTF